MKATIAASLLALSTAATAQCVPVPQGTLDPAAPFDNWSAATPFGFAFPFLGTTFTDFYYSDHGLIALTNGGTPAAPPGNAQVWDPGSVGPFNFQGMGFAGFGANVIMPYWGDHTTGADGIYIDNTSGTHCTITWSENEPYNAFSAGAFTVQLTLYPDGRFTIIQDSRCNNTSSSYGPVTSVVGVYEDGSTIPGSSDFSAGTVASTGGTCFEEFVGPGPVNSNTPDPSYDLGNTITEFIPAPPGWVVTNGTLPCASTTTSGTACGGLAHAAVNEPQLGGSYEMETTNVPAGSAIGATLIGFGNPMLPLGGLGFPGCTQYADNTAVILEISPASSFIASMTIPFDATFNGLVIFSQGMALTPPASLAAANGAAGTIGH